MVHRTVAILLILTLLASNFTKSFALASFVLNRKYIVEKLCENRAKPQLGCLGKCFLKKQLKQAAEQEKRDATSSLKKADEPAVTPVQKQPYPFYSLIRVFLPPANADLFSIASPPIFHPPC
ncbi:MAG TPA: hypothetical protein VGD92_09100 [Sphingobacteriaceae bacterium]